MGGYGPRGLAAALSGPGQLFWYAYATLAFQTNISTRHVLRVACLSYAGGLIPFRQAGVGK
jgi:hypothetical protein